VDLGISGRVALVLGASKGLGYGSARSLAGDGALVAVASRSAERATEAAGRIATESGAQARGYAVDTADLESLPGLVEQVASDLGPVDILVTNTGGPPLGEPLGFGREDWESGYRSLVLAPLELIKAVVPGMRERGWGRIVNVTSLATKEPIPGLMLSNSHRLAAVGMFKTLANDLAREGILVNSVAPGAIATDRIASTTGMPLEQLEGMEQTDIPVGRLGRIDEFGDVVAFLCSERASYVCGVNLLVDGGRASGI
jgi:3-oxoacyl-[acyl-carrier protein] reductase